MTIEGVADRAGVAKTTIYRQWADRGELLFALFEKPLDRDRLPDTGDLRADLISHCRHLQHDLLETPKAAMLFALIDGAEQEARFDELAGDFARARRAAVIRRLERGVEHGQLPADTDLELLTAAIAGPLFYRRYFGRQATCDDDIARLVDAALGSPPRR